MVVVRCAHGRRVLLATLVVTGGRVSGRRSPCHPVTPPPCHPSLSFLGKTRRCVVGLLYRDVAIHETRQASCVHDEGRSSSMFQVDDHQVLETRRIAAGRRDRKSTRLNSSHTVISY